MRRRLPTFTPLCACGDHAFASIGRGHVVLVSPEDAELVRDATWQVLRGYARVKSPKPIKGKRMHRLILAPSDRMEVDHANHDRLDNRRHNIREATHSQNMHRRRNVSSLGYRGVKGVSSGLFGSMIEVRGRAHWLGTFKTAEEAARAFDDAAVALHGEFALTNEALGLFSTAQKRVQR